MDGGKEAIKEERRGEREREEEKRQKKASHVEICWSNRSYGEMEEKAKLLSDFYFDDGTLYLIPTMRQIIFKVVFQK